MESTPMLAVGDPRRRQLGRAAFGTLVVGALFVVFAVAVKQFRVLSDHVPWQNDPYDAVVSFTVFFIPLTAAMGMVRMSLCRRSRPLPVARVISVMRGGRVVIGAMLLTVLSDWISVALQVDRATWNAATATTLALLAAVTALVIAAGVVHVRASRLIRGLGDGSHVSDWFSDLVAAAELSASWLGPLKLLGVRLIGWVDRRVVGAIRRDPVISASGAALAFGLLLALNTLLREGPGPAIWLDVLVGGSGMFAFLVAAGAYLGLVGADRPAAGTRRRVIDAAVIGCAAVPVAVAFRDWLWWIVGTATGGAGRLAELLVIVGVAAAAIVFAGEAIFRVHGSGTA
ncbi:MAG TPA: hypothetical protein VND54_06430 [Candidatus Saccharimonadales bacterium]|nr:hypothetical protein [Candidatus Saccharimonadales bacterium]